jgi:hypothetical protein
MVCKRLWLDWHITFMKLVILRQPLIFVVRPLVFMVSDFEPPKKGLASSAPNLESFDSHRAHMRTEQITLPCCDNISKTGERRVWRWNRVWNFSCNLALITKSPRLPDPPFICLSENFIPSFTHCRSLWSTAWLARKFISPERGSHPVPLTGNNKIKTNVAFRGTMMTGQSKDRKMITDITRMQ